MLKKDQAPEREQKDMLTLRIASKVNQYTKSKAEAMGISQNAFINILIDLGLRVYERDVGFISSGQ